MQDAEVTKSLQWLTVVGEDRGVRGKKGLMMIGSRVRGGKGGSKGALEVWERVRVCKGVFT